MTEQPPHPQQNGPQQPPDEPPEDPVSDTQPVPGPAHDTLVDDPAPPSLWQDGRHPVHVAHLVMGIAFAGLLLVWALLYTGVSDGDDVRWLLPLPWLLAGTAGLVAAGRNARRRS